jgi:tetratricopeptide (TPR) repeat protein
VASMRQRSSLVAFVMAAFVMLQHAQARADDYDELIDEALAEFDAGHFEEALAAFEQAYDAKPSARALRGVAKTLFELRSYARCVATIDRALATDTEPLTGALRADLEALRARALRFVGRVAIDVKPASATAVLDGKPIDLRGAAPLVLDVGRHSLEVTAPDHHPARRIFEVRGGDVSRIAVELQPVPKVVAAGASGDGRSTSIALALGALGASATGVVASSLWRVDRDAAVERCNEAASLGARCANADAVAFQRDASAWAIGLSGAATVASALALVLVLRADSPSRAACAPLPGGVSCGAMRMW